MNWLIVDKIFIKILKKIMAFEFILIHIWVEAISKHTKVYEMFKMFLIYLILLYVIIKLLIYFKFPKKVS